MEKVTTFGGKLRQIREAKRFIIADCAERANMKASQWSRMEADEPKRDDGSVPVPRLETVRKVIAALDLNLAFSQDREWLRELYALTPYSPPTPPAVVRPTTTDSQGYVRRPAVGPGSVAEETRESARQREEELLELMNDDRLTPEAKDRLKARIRLEVQLELEAEERERRRRGESSERQ